MLKSINFKIWIVIFVTLVLSLVAMLLLTQLSVKNRFLDYATTQILERLKPIETSIVEIHEQTGSLSSFSSSPQKWIRLRDSTYRQYLRVQKDTGLFYVSPDSLNKNKSKDIEANQRIFFQHLTLHDANRKLLSGQPLDEFRYILKPVYYQGEIIAHIGYVRPKAFLNPVDQVFVDQQFRSFAIICVAMIFTSLIIAGLASRWLVAPLSILAKNAQRVTKGDFSARTPITRNDELGELCADFNEMAHTLEKNEEARKQWVADISHELRTPLSVLKAQIEAMEDGIREANSKNLSLLHNNIDTLNFLVEDLYELSLSDMGAISYDKKPTLIKTLIEEVSDSFSVKADEKNIAIKHSTSPLLSDQQANIDRKRFKQLLQNIFENSLRYTDTPGNIEIVTSIEDNRIAIHISDSKPGIPNNALEKIFDRLYRIDTSRSRKKGGAGLGLSICKNIVEAHNGSIHANHSHFGGVKISIYLPKI